MTSTSNPTIIPDNTLDDGGLADDFNAALWALITPFILIPGSIIVARLVKYAWKIYQAKKYGYDDDLFEDPLAELGLKIKRGYENTAEIRKIRKEQRMLRDELRERAKMNELNMAEQQSDIRNTLLKTFQLEAAGTYLESLRKQTRRAWMNRLSPDAVRRWVTTSKYARAWMVFQVLCTILAIVNYVALTYLVRRDDRSDSKLIKNLDLFYAAIFALDYFLSFYTAEDRLRFYLNPISLVDLISIISPFVFVLVSSDAKFVWFVGLLRIFRATRILRTYRILAFSQSEETRELTSFVLSFFNFIFFSASIINACESLVVNWNTPPSLLNWHDSLYYIMVTFSTIGFGDLTPSSTMSRVIVMCLIVLVIIYVPYQTSKIVEIYNSLSRYQRASYSASSDKPHVIVSGTITSSVLIDFCREYFVADPIGVIVILHTDEPDLYMRRLLNHPFYRNRLVYLRGNLMSAPDLRRAAAPFATSLFLLNSGTSNNAAASLNEEDEIKRTRGMDAQVLMQTLVSKNSFPGLPIFAQVQDIRSQDLSQHCGCDRVLCVDEIKMSLMGLNCIVPGSQTLILNLIHSYRELQNSTLTDFWLQEYQCGIANQIHSFKLPSGLVGMTFLDAAREVYDAYGVMLFALISTNSGFNQNSVRISIPTNYRIKSDDIAFCISDGGDETILRISIQFKENFRKKEMERRDLELEMAKVLHENIEDLLPIDSQSLSTMNLIDSQFQEMEEQGKIEVGSIPHDINEHIILCGHMTSRAVRQFVTSVRGGTEGKQDSFSIRRRKVPILCILEKLPSEDDLNGIWLDILGNTSTYILQGTPVKKTSLLQARIDKCARIVVLANPESEKSDDSIPDSNSLFIVKLIQREWPHVKFLVELIDGSNVRYFSAKNLEWNTDNLRMQSILSNYALSIGDRLTLYRKIRTEGAEKLSIWYQLVQLVFGDNDSAKTKSPDSQYQKQKKSEKKKRDAVNNMKAYTNPSIIKQAKLDGDYEAVEHLHDIELQERPDGFNRNQASQHENDGNDDRNDDEDEDPDEDKADLTITEAYLQRLLQEAELNESGLSPYPVYHFDRHFAAGMVSTSSFVHSLLCQIYFRPYIVDVIRAFTQNLIQIPVSEKIAGKHYIDVVHFCLKAGYIPIGLYRKGALAANSPIRERPSYVGGKSSDADSLPYVYTNCRPGDIVNKEDMIYAIKRNKDST